MYIYIHTHTHDESQAGRRGTCNELEAAWARGGE